MPALHEPHCSVPPQPSAISPQRPAQVSGWQLAHWFVAPSHTWPKAHAPQSMPPPQASVIVPQPEFPHACSGLTH
jgi:hypothetical protein